MKLLEEQFIFTKNVAKLIQYIYSSGYKCTLGEVFRTKEQAQIYAREGLGIIDSLHCSRLAIDLNLFSPKDVYLTQNSDYLPFGRYWENLHPHNYWGGFYPRKDSGHFEMKEA
jgi:hypothetical protein